METGTYNCDQCGKEYWLGDDGVSSHMNASGGTNHELDADHVPYGGRNKFSPMTYKQLLVELQKLSSEQLDATVTVYHVETDEYYPARSLYFTKESETNVLDPDHPVILIPIQ